METQRYDHLDGVLGIIELKLNDLASAIPVAQRIANIEEKIQLDTLAPPEKKSRKGKAKSRAPVGQPRRRDRLTATDIGFQCSIIDGCVFYLRGHKGLRGIMGLTVDDAVNGGDKQFEEACEKLRMWFSFGALFYKKGKYTGKKLVQSLGNSEITESQSRSSADIQLIGIFTERRK
ncbi:unnamed protein product, partial [Prorocentrum cordatum]